MDTSWLPNLRKQASEYGSNEIIIKQHSYNIVYEDVANIGPKTLLDKASVMIGTGYKQGLLQTV